jgi:hypothetical protein
VFDYLRKLFGPPATPEDRPQTGALPPGEPVAPITLRVLMIVHDPPLVEHGGRRLHEVFGWSDPAKLAQQYIADLRMASSGYLNYEIVERIDAGWFPPKVDGFQYTSETYLRAWQTRAFHEPDAIDYSAQLRAFNLIERYNRGEFDEAWFFSFPYAGDYESMIVGRNAFWCNAPPMQSRDCNRRFVMMMFNYERDVGCMLENFGHRVESIMSHMYERHGGRNMWEVFTRYDQIAPGQAQCGNVHFAPNSQRDYDWGNRRAVRSFCDDWYSYPLLPGHARTVTCSEWGNGDMRAHHIWWLQHLPHGAGETDGVANNWWQYVADPNLVP